MLYAVSTQPPKRSEQAIPVDFRQLFEAVHADDRLLLDDGRLTLQVASVEENWLVARVIVGGLLSSHKGINLPGCDCASPASQRRMNRICALASRRAWMPWRSHLCVRSRMSSRFAP